MLRSRTLRLACLAVSLSAVSFAASEQKSAAKENIAGDMVVVDRVSAEPAAPPVDRAKRPAGNPDAPPSVPPLVRFNGFVPMAPGKYNATFGLYLSDNGGDALWQEAQTIDVDTSGNYTVLLGAGTPQGLPPNVFTSQGVEYLSVRLAGAAEQPRLLMVSVPFALKADDADHLSGLTASNFMSVDQANILIQNQVSSLFRDAMIQAVVAHGGTPADAASGHFNFAQLFPNLTTQGTTAAGATSFQDTSANEVVLIQQLGTGIAVNAITAGSVGVQASTSSPTGTGVYGSASSGIGTGIGVRGDTAGIAGQGVLGFASAQTGTGVGVQGTSAGNAGIGVQGTAQGASGVGVHGVASNASGATAGVLGETFSSTGAAGLFNVTQGSAKILVGESNGAVRFSVDSGGTIVNAGNVQSAGNVLAGGNVTAVGNVTAAGKFIGDGSLLTGIAGTFSPAGIFNFSGNDTFSGNNTFNGTNVFNQPVTVTDGTDVATKALNVITNTTGIAAATVQNPPPAAIFASSNNTTGITAGVIGIVQGYESTGVVGVNANTTGIGQQDAGAGVTAITESPFGKGIEVQTDSTTGSTIGINVNIASPDGKAINVNGPWDGGSSDVITIGDGNGSQLFRLDSSGNLTVLGTISGAGGTGGGGGNVSSGAPNSFTAPNFFNTSGQATTAVTILNDATNDTPALQVINTNQTDGSAAFFLSTSTVNPTVEIANNSGQALLVEPVSQVLGNPQAGMVIDDAGNGTALDIESSSASIFPSLEINNFGTGPAASLVSSGSAATLNVTNGSSGDAFSAVSGGLEVFGVGSGEARIGTVQAPGQQNGVSSFGLTFQALGFDPEVTSQFDESFTWAVSVHDQVSQGQASTASLDLFTRQSGEGPVVSISENGVISAAGFNGNGFQPVNFNTPILINSFSFNDSLQITSNGSANPIVVNSESGQLFRIDPFGTTTSNNLTIPAQGTAAPLTFYASGALDLVSSVWDGTQAVNDFYRWQTQPNAETGENPLVLMHQFGDNSLNPILSINTNGTINFAPGQNLFNNNRPQLLNLTQQDGGAALEIITDGSQGIIASNTHGPAGVFNGPSHPKGSTISGITGDDALVSNGTLSLPIVTPDQTPPAASPSNQIAFEATAYDATGFYQNGAPGQTSFQWYVSAQPIHSNDPANPADATLSFQHSFSRGTPVEVAALSKDGLSIGGGDPIQKHISVLLTGLVFNGTGPCAVIGHPISGASPGDTVALGPSDPIMNNGNVLLTGWINVDGVLQIRACDVGNSSINVTGDIRVDVWKHVPPTV